MPAVRPRPAPPHRPTRGQALRPFTRENRRQRRLSRRIAAGLTLAQAARAEGLPEPEVARLLADPAFADLVAAYREIQDEPEGRARESLRRFARTLLEDALIEGDVGAAMFILREEARGRDPADTLAAGVVATFRRQAAADPAPPPASPPPTPPPAPEVPSPRPPREPADRACWRVAARLRDRLLHEAAILRQASGPAPGELLAATAGPAPTPSAAEPAPGSAARPRPVRPAPNRRERRRLAATRRRAPPPGPPPTGDRPRGRPPP